MPNCGGCPRLLKKCRVSGVKDMVVIPKVVFRSIQEVGKKLSHHGRSRNPSLHSDFLLNYHFEAKGRAKAGSGLFDVETQVLEKCGLVLRHGDPVMESGVTRCHIV